MIVWSTLLMVVASSFDSLAVGLSYGCAGIRVPSYALVIPALFTGGMFFVAMSWGNALAVWLSPSVARWAGGALLVAMGAKALDANGPEFCPAEKPLACFSFMGLMLLVLKDSEAADLDSSKVLDRKEAAVLGAVLGLDALGLGLSAAFTGLPRLPLSVLVSLLTPMSLVLGIALGERWRPPAAVMRRVPAWTLVVLGLLRLLQ